MASYVGVARHDQRSRPDMARWEDEDHFASWLGLFQITASPAADPSPGDPTRHQSSGHRLTAGGHELLRSQSTSCTVSRFRSRLGAPKAITGHGPQAGRLGVSHAQWGTSNVDRGMQYYEERTATNKSACSRSEPPSSAANCRTPGRGLTFPTVSGEKRHPRFTE